MFVCPMSMSVCPVDMGTGCRSMMLSSITDATARRQFISFKGPLSIVPHPSSNQFNDALLLPNQFT